MKYFIALALVSLVACSGTSLEPVPTADDITAMENTLTRNLGRMLVDNAPELIVDVHGDGFAVKRDTVHVRIPQDVYSPFRQPLINVSYPVMPGWIRDNGN